MIIVSSIRLVCMAMSGMTLIRAINQSDVYVSVCLCVCLLVFLSVSLSVALVSLSNTDG